MNDNWRYIVFLYKNHKYLKKDLFSKISDKFMNIIDDKKKCGLIQIIHLI